MQDGAGSMQEDDVIIMWFHDVIARMTQKINVLKCIYYKVGYNNKMYNVCNVSIRTVRIKCF